MGTDELDSVARKTEETLSIGEFDASVHEDKLEALAYEISQSSPEIARRSVEFAVASITSSKSPLGPQLLAWLLLYGVLEPLQILQTVIFSQDSSILRVCGTSEFADDVIEHLHLSPCKARTPKFAGKYSSTRILVDFLDSSVSALSRNVSRRAPVPYEHVSERAPVESPGKESHAKASEESQAKPRVKPDPAYDLQIRKILRASMSAEEAVHKLLGVYVKNTEDLVMQAILQICQGLKVYNRFFGNLSTRLCRQNQRLFGDALFRVFTEFCHNCEDLDVDPLRVSAQYFGHLLSTSALSWTALQALSLAPSKSTPSTRILLLAIFEELKASMGVEAVETKAYGELQSMDGLLRPELAIGFWDLAGFPRLVETAVQLQERDAEASFGQDASSA